METPRGGLAPTPPPTQAKVAKHGLRARVKYVLSILSIYLSYLDQRHINPYFPSESRPMIIPEQQHCPGAAGCGYPGADAGFLPGEGAQ